MIFCFSKYYKLLEGTSEREKKGGEGGGQPIKMNYCCYKKYTFLTLKNLPDSLIRLNIFNA